ncbi:hypothetical protein ADUPG1_007799 [Aduncisulcus paluster]|uniref:Uncharacterized protein n=1 Tax=Aduncisulcus paluster TaxID=2918883 RepID=A0ABQ5KR16_9EUKA|nr:hypothetical protein ADUPG1_007799 [Aduncisulcus paluster]
MTVVKKDECKIKLLFLSKRDFMTAQTVFSVYDDRNDRFFPGVQFEKQSNLFFTPPTSQLVIRARFINDNFNKCLITKKRKECFTSGLLKSEEEEEEIDVTPPTKSSDSSSSDPFSIADIYEKSEIMRSTFSAPPDIVGRMVTNRMCFKWRDLSLQLDHAILPSSERYELGCLIDPDKLPRKKVITLHDKCTGDCPIETIKEKIEKELEGWDVSFTPSRGSKYSQLLDDMGAGLV